MPAGRVPLLKTCEDHKAGPIFDTGGDTVLYQRCHACGFVWCSEMCAWSRSMFRERIYNDDYAQADPDYLDTRPTLNAKMLDGWFKRAATEIRHMDYGGGNGELARQMRARGFDSHSWDPLACQDCKAFEGRSFNLVTAFEVFEHAPDPRAMRGEISKLLAGDGLLVFSTLTSDSLGPQWHPEDFWYAAPRNGHVCIYSKRALRHLLYPLRVYHMGEGFHFAFSTCPKWVELSVQ